jgi:hypothetical protein
MRMFKEFDRIEKLEKDLEKDFYTYDSKEDIEKCLNCKKSECNNCLKHKNFV